MTIISVLVSLSWGEKVHLEAYSTNPDSIAIGVLPFTAQSEQILKTSEPWKIIADDLDFSGKFSVLRAQKGDSAVFAQKNTAIYITGSYLLQGSLIAITGELRDAKTHEQLMEKRFDGATKSERTMMHEFSNTMVEMLFNTKGIFLSKMLIVKDDGDVKNIVVMDYDGFNQRAVTSNKSINIFPTFVDSTAFIWTSFSRGHPELFFQRENVLRSFPAETCKPLRRCRPWTGKWFLRRTAKVTWKYIPATPMGPA